MFSPQELVWSNPYLRDNILIHLSTRQALPLLRTSKTLFHFAIGKIYKKFYWEHYHPIIAICEDRSRRRAYWDAVTTLHFDWPSRPSVPCKAWTHYLSVFPNVSTVVFHYPNDQHHGVLQCPFNSDKPTYVLDQHLDCYGSEFVDHSPRKVDLPVIDGSTNFSQRVILDLGFFYPVSYEPRRRGNYPSNTTLVLSDILEKHLKGPTAVLGSIYLGPAFPNQDLLNAIQDTNKSQETISLKILASCHIDQALIDIITSQGRTLRELWIGHPRGTLQPLDLNELVERLPWHVFYTLTKLIISCNRQSSKNFSSHFSSLPFSIQNLPTGQYAAPGYGLKDLSVQVNYPYTKDQSLLTADIEVEKELIKILARRIISLLDPTDLPPNYHAWFTAYPVGTGSVVLVSRIEELQSVFRQEMMDHFGKDALDRVRYGFRPRQIYPF